MQSRQSMSVKPASFVVVVLPAYEAERTVGQTIADLPVGTADHVLLVDDASHDATVAVARGLGIDVRARSENGGYGANQKTCYQEALRLKATVVVLLHPDYQYDPKSVPSLIAPILKGEADMTFGSRFANGADPRRGGMPAYRYFGNRVTTFIQNRLLGTKFTEMHSGMRAYTRELLEGLPLDQYSDDFLFDTQVLAGAHVRGYRIQEVAIPTRYTKDSSSIGIRRSVVYVALSLRECWHARRHA